MLLDIQPDALPSMANFVIGRNAEALHSLHQALQTGAESRFIYFWGAEGSGKSHLLKAAQGLAQASNTHLVIADDVNLLDDEAQIALFDAYNQTRVSNGVLLAAGNASPSQMNLRDDLSTRLAWGLTYQLHPLTDEEKAQAMQAHAQERGMKLPNEVVDYCLRYLRRDLPSLMAILDALDEWSLTEMRPVTVPLLKKLLQLPLI